MSEELKSGYNKMEMREPFILEPEDWSAEEWVTLCKIYGVPADRTERIVIGATPVECFLHEEKPHTVAEYCPNCETEIEMRWDIESMGYKAFCPVCGNRLMLCDECQHRTGGACTEDCDYDTRTDTCRFNTDKREEREKPLTLEELLGMDGQPAWFLSKKDGFGEWGIVRIVTMSKMWFIAISGAERAFGDKDTYGTAWLAYRSKPEQATP